MKTSGLIRLLAPLVLAPAATADRIVLVDGGALEGVEVVDELLSGVTYRLPGESGERRVDPDEVLRIEYGRLPPELDQAEALIRGGDPAAALERLSLFVDSVLHGVTRKDRPLWAPGYALDRSARLRLGLGDLGGAARAADLLMQERPVSRHMPSALLIKAEALRGQGAAPAAEATLSSLRALIAAEGLSARWSLELELFEIRADTSLSEIERRERLTAIARRAEPAYPSVRSRALVAAAESYLAGEASDFDRAREVFEQVVADPRADRDALAAAYTGLGDCWFHAATATVRAGAKDDLEKALLAYMRVVISYGDQAGYVPKAMYFAGRASDLLGEAPSSRNARRLYRAVISSYPTSPWAAEARNLRQ